MPEVLVVSEDCEQFWQDLHPFDYCHFLLCSDYILYPTLHHCFDVSNTLQCKWAQK